MLAKYKIRIFIAVIVLLVFLSASGALNPAEKFLAESLAPTEIELYASSNEIQKFLYYLFNYKKLIDKNQQLEQQLSDQKTDQTKISQLEEENQSLKNSLNYIDNESKDFITAKIIGRTTLNSQIFILNKGSENNIIKGLAVVYNNGIMLGKISQVEENISYLTLLTDNQSEIAVKILNSDKTMGLVKGELGVNTKIEMIPQDEELKINDIVVTSGLERNIPEGLLVGEVQEINQNPSELLKEAFLEPYFNLKNLDYVMIILPNYE